jgi:hypothetical protein
MQLRSGHKLSTEDAKKVSEPCYISNISYLLSKNTVEATQYAKYVACQDNIVDVICISNAFIRQGIIPEVTDFLISVIQDRGDHPD